MKDNNTMMWVLAAAAAWILWRQGTFDPYIDGFSASLPNGDVAATGNGETVVDVISGGANGDAGLVNGVSGIADWENIYG